jgi:hypothetical protein
LHHLCLHCSQGFERPPDLAYFGDISQRTTLDVPSLDAARVPCDQDDDLVDGLVLNPEPAKDIGFFFLKHRLQFSDGILGSQPPDCLVQRHVVGLGVGLRVPPQRLAHRHLWAALSCTSGDRQQDHNHQDKQSN